MEHHAYLLLGDKETAEAYLESVFSELAISPIGNQDVHFIETPTFLIEEARRLSEQAQVKAFGSKKIFVIKSIRFTTEAQNALLKTFEEPPADTHFFILSNDENLFLPTLLSRLFTIRLKEKGNVNREAEAFLSLPLSKRIAFARKFADEKEERGPGALSSFLDSLLLSLQKSKASLPTLEKVFKLRLFAEDPAVATRLVLEHLSLVLE